MQYRQDDNHSLMCGVLTVGSTFLHDDGLPWTDGQPAVLHTVTAHFPPKDDTHSSSDTALWEGGQPALVRSLTAPLPSRDAAKSKIQGMASRDPAKIKLKRKVSLDASLCSSDTYDICRMSTADSWSHAEDTNHVLVGDGQSESNRQLTKVQTAFEQPFPFDA